MVDDTVPAVDENVLAESGCFAADDLCDEHSLEKVLLVDPCAGGALLLALVDGEHFVEGLERWHLAEDVTEGQVVVVGLLLDRQPGRSFQPVLEYALVKHTGGIEVDFIGVYFDLVDLGAVRGVCFSDKHVFGLGVGAVKLQS